MRYAITLTNMLRTPASDLCKEFAAMTAVDTNGEYVALCDTPEQAEAIEDRVKEWNEK